MISSWLSAKLGVGTGAGRVRMTKRGWMCISGLGYGAVCLSMGLHPALWAVLVLWFIWGMFYGPEEVLGQVLFADAIDEHMRGRVYSFMGVVFLPSGYGRVPHHRMGGTSVRRDQHHCYRRGTLHHRHRIHVHSRPDCASDTGAGIAE